MQARCRKYELIFKRPAGTSRGVLNTKETWFIMLEDEGRTGIGECAIFRGLSSDDRPEYAEILQSVCSNIEAYLGDPSALEDWPSIRFGLESAMFWLENGPSFGDQNFVNSNRGIKINGLIWMGDEQYMLEQIESKLTQGFSCLKMKIGALDFQKEMDILERLRARFPADQLELRVDANGAFSPDDALAKLKRLAELQIHSIEQPIRAAQLEEMSKLCAETNIPIALDEELIGVNKIAQKKELLDKIRPQYIILKPSLHGGFKGSEEWIDIAGSLGIAWWMTSALESNLGLNAIAQYLSQKDIHLPQGLGTGQLFENNIPSPLELRSDQLFYNQAKSWDLQMIGK